jgi:hypothetical protein
MPRSLDEIRADIRLCEEYARTGTLQAAFKYLADTNRNLLALLEHVEQMEGPADDRSDS